MALVEPLERARRIWTSAPVAVALLVAANLVPLAGVLFFGWELFTVLVLYWLENGIVGAFNVIKMSLAAAPDQVPGSERPLPPAQAYSKLFMVPFFVVHYGVFWVVHGVFVFVLAMLSGGDALFPRVPIELQPVLIGAAALALSHGSSLVFNYVGRGEYRHTSPRAQMAQPYPRMIVLHLTIVLGAVLVLGLGQPVLLIGLLVVLKTALDLLLHLREHARLGRVGPATDAPA